MQSALAQAQSLAAQARFDESLTLCQEIVNTHINNPDALLDVGSMLMGFGFLSAARQCFTRAAKIAPNDMRPVANLANLAREIGQHAESRRLYCLLLEHFPNHPVIRRNALMGLEYDPEASDDERLQKARKWGEWATARAALNMPHPHPRPELRRIEGRPLRVGYVSADICQHTVGLFVKDVLGNHDPASVIPFVYSAGRVSDWVTAAVRAACSLRDVSALDDSALADLIRQDEIDVLVDLSGHTAGSRLTMFAHRPAPVQVSWLGYFATTGLACMDAVLLDKWHAPEGTEARFVEPIIRLPGGRFCYTPVPYAPEAAPVPPHVSSGRITLGCFNNTTKLNAGVFDVWARILAAVPNSRLALKWRTFQKTGQDAGLGQSVRTAFSARGVDPQRIELRGASFHVDLLKEYADIDIALDPFPFTGGLTSCEALWMGVPVVTWPQNRVVSRQTTAFLSAVGLPELAASDADEYVQIATALAGDTNRLKTLRADLRERMRTSPLCDVAGFTRNLESAFFELTKEGIKGV